MPLASLNTLMVCHKIKEVEGLCFCSSMGKNIRAKLFGCECSKLLIKSDFRLDLLCHTRGIHFWCYDKNSVVINLKIFFWNRWTKKTILNYKTARIKQLNKCAMFLLKRHTSYRQLCHSIVIQGVRRKYLFINLVSIRNILTKTDEVLVSFLSKYSLVHTF